jgi:hypothetical protein
VFKKRGLEAVKKSMEQHFPPLADARGSDLARLSEPRP